MKSILKKIILGSLGVWGGFVFVNSSVFWIKHIHIEGIEGPLKQRIILDLESYLGHSLILLPLKEIEQKIKLHSEIKQIDIKKKFPNSLEIKCTKNKPIDFLLSGQSTPNGPQISGLSHVERVKYWTGMWEATGAAKFLTLQGIHFDQGVIFFLSGVAKPNLKLQVEFYTSKWPSHLVEVLLRLIEKNILQAQVYLYENKKVVVKPLSNS